MHIICLDELKTNTLHNGKSVCEIVTALRHYSCILFEYDTGVVSCTLQHFFFKDMVTSCNVSSINVK
jgi:hypothetical protein